MRCCFQLSWDALSAYGISVQAFCSNFPPPLELSAIPLSVSFFTDCRVYFFFFCSVCVSHKPLPECQISGTGQKSIGICNCHQSRNPRERNSEVTTPQPIFIGFNLGSFTFTYSEIKEQCFAPISAGGGWVGGWAGRWGLDQLLGNYAKAQWEIYATGWSNHW